MADGASRGCLLGLAIMCFSAALVLLAVMVWGPEVIAALFLTMSAGIGITACLAALADGK